MPKKEDKKSRKGLWVLILSVLTAIFSVVYVRRNTLRQDIEQLHETVTEKRDDLRDRAAGTRP